MKALERGMLLRDPRYVSQLIEEQLAREGLSCQIGPEVECFILDDIVFANDLRSCRACRQVPYQEERGYDAPPFQDSLAELRFEIVQILKKNYLIRVTNMNHEAASSGQMEINFMHSTLTKSADNVQIYKETVRNVAKKHYKVANYAQAALTKAAPKALKAIMDRTCMSASAYGHRQQRIITTSFTMQTIPTPS